MDSVPTPHQRTERRSKPRIACSYPAIVQGWDGNGRRMRVPATVTNMSANGLCLMLKADVKPGDQLFVLFRCSATGPLGNSKAPLLAVGGVIVREASPLHGIRQVGFQIQHNRFL